MWEQHLNPDTQVMSLKYIIVGKTQRDVNEFRLVTREGPIDESKTLRENGITAETVIFVEDIKR